MKPTRVVKGHDLTFQNLPLDPSPENIEKAASFAFAKWHERWSQRKSEWENSFSSPFSESEPEDLSGSCKFSSVFAAVVFDYGIDGNYDHQFAIKKGHVIDLNSGAADVQSMEKPYAIDPLFFGSKDHMKSMKSCVPRILEWLSKFDEELSMEATPQVSRSKPSAS